MKVQNMYIAIYKKHQGCSMKKKQTRTVIKKCGKPRAAFVQSVEV